MAPLQSHQQTSTSTTVQQPLHSSTEPEDHLQPKPAAALSLTCDDTQPPQQHRSHYREIIALNNMAVDLMQKDCFNDANHILAGALHAMNACLRGSVNFMALLRDADQRKCRATPTKSTFEITSLSDEHLSCKQFDLKAIEYNLYAIRIDDAGIECKTALFLSVIVLHNWALACLGMCHSMTNRCQRKQLFGKSVMLLRRSLLLLEKYSKSSPPVSSYIMRHQSTHLQVAILSGLWHAYRWSDRGSASSSNNSNGPSCHRLTQRLNEVCRQAQGIDSILASIDPVRTAAAA